MTRQDILQAVSAERQKQIADGWTLEHDNKHTELEWMAILNMQIGKSATHAIFAHELTSHNSMYTARRHQQKWRERLIAIAAVCVAAIEASERADEVTP